MQVCVEMEGTYSQTMSKGWAFNIKNEPKGQICQGALNKCPFNSEK